MFGEQLSLFSVGETYLKLKLSDYSDKTTTANYKGVGGSFDQYFNMFDGQHLLIFSGDFTKLHYYEYEAYNSNIFLLRLIYMMFEPIKSYTFQFYLSASVTDPINQKETRGYEYNFNPGIDISKSLTENLRFSINYNFMKNTSKDEQYLYQKQLYGVELSYTF